MKYVDEFRDRAVAAALAERIKKTVRRPWTIMAVYGGQTHAIVRFGLDSLLPQDLTLVQGGARTRSLRWVGGHSRGTYQSVRTCLYCRMRLSFVSTVAFSSLAVATMI